MPTPPSRRGPALGAVLTTVLASLLALAGCAPATGPGATTGPGTRPVVHARGTASVPVTPQRVVVLEPVALDTAVALGVTPVGAAVLSEAVGVPAYLGEAARTTAVVGTVPAPDLERIAALQPDLVIGTQTRHADLHDQLAAIAPTVFLADHAAAWQDNVAAVATALGRPEEGDRVLGAYRERCAAVAATVPEGATAQMIRPRDGQLTLYGPTSFAGSTLECAGFTTPERDWEGSISVDLSYERAAEARADLIVVTTRTPDDPGSLPPVLATVGLDVVAVDESVWVTGVGPLGGGRVLDDIERLAADL